MLMKDVVVGEVYAKANEVQGSRYVSLRNAFPVRVDSVGKGGRMEYTRLDPETLEPVEVRDGTRSYGDTVRYLHGEWKAVQETLRKREEARANGLAAERETSDALMALFPEDVRDEYRDLLCVRETGNGTFSRSVRSMPRSELLAMLTEVHRAGRLSAG